MTLPIAPVVMPADLASQTNGKLDPILLWDVGPSGRLHHLAARAFRALVSAAWDQGLPLTYTFGGTYRSYAQQETLFRSRYEIGGAHGGCKNWNGQTWCKKLVNGRVPATAAVPGTSNHGWGLAIDTAFDTDPVDGLGPEDAAAITAHPQWPWFLANAERFGFSWELQSEPWHIRYVTGDRVPDAVLAFEGTLKPTPPPTKENDMVRIDLNPGTPQWVSMVIGATTCTHTVDGFHALVLERAQVAQVVVTEREVEGILRSLETTNASPFAPDRPSANPTLHALWEAARPQEVDALLLEQD